MASSAVLRPAPRRVRLRLRYDIYEIVNSPPRRETLLALLVSPHFDFPDQLIRLYRSAKRIYASKYCVKRRFSSLIYDKVNSRRKTAAFLVFLASLRFVPHRINSRVPFPTVISTDVSEANEWRNLARQGVTPCGALPAASRPPPFLLLPSPTGGAVTAR